MRASFETKETLDVLTESPAAKAVVGREVQDRGEQHLPTADSHAGLRGTDTQDMVIRDSRRDGKYTKEIGMNEPGHWELVGGDSKVVRHTSGHYQLVLECLSHKAESLSDFRLRDVVDELNAAAELRKALETAHDAMCQASFFVKRNKSDLNHAIDIARKILGLHVKKTTKAVPDKATT